MNISGGLYRLAQVIKFGGRAVFVLCLTVFSASFFETFFESQNIEGGLFAVGLGLLFLIATEASAWVLEGFIND